MIGSKPDILDWAHPPELHSPAPVPERPYVVYCGTGRRCMMRSAEEVCLESVPGEVTQLLKAMHAGAPGAADRLLPLVYSELHRLAQAYMRRERPDHTLQATALINEAYLRLAGEDIDWSSRAQFIGLAAHVMRQVLVDYARQHRAARRAGGFAA